LELTKSIEISDVSGASVLLAPEMQHLLALMQSPDIHGVVTREFSRLMRPENFADYALLQAFVDSKTVLYLPEGPIDLNSKTGRLMGTIRAAIAGMERTEILERIWSAKEEKRRRGELAQSEIVLPFAVGYSKELGFYYKPDAKRVVWEVFHQFLTGQHNYSVLARILGVTPRGAHLILRNPIYTGWRIIDKKRDISAAGRYPGVNGRQADRRKVARTPEDVIRVKVIAEGLISEEEFQSVQRIMDLRQTKHWKSRSCYEHRFTYQGFLTCSTCGELVYTAFARRDYYACKGRRVSHACSTRYMERRRLEGLLDDLFAQRLTDPRFIEYCVGEQEHRSKRQDSEIRRQRLRGDILGLQRRRVRVIEGSIDGVISREDRNRRVAEIDKEIKNYQEALIRAVPRTSPTVDVLVEALAPLVEWQHWTRDQKRTVLAAIAPDIRVADYRVESIGFRQTLFSHEDTRSGRGS
jgi:DNA invertase Pin-like site-specific DNA recombinase